MELICCFIQFSRTNGAIDGHREYLLIMVDGHRTTWKDAFTGDPNKTNEVSHSDTIAAQERWIDHLIVLTYVAS